MPNVRLDHKRKKYWLSRNALRHAMAYCYMYEEWKKEYNELMMLRSVNYDGMPHGSSTGSAIEDAAIRAAELSDKMYIVDATLNKADPEIAKWMKKAVTIEGMTFSDLEAQGIPCCSKKYYETRRKFYFLLAKKI